MNALLRSSFSADHRPSQDVQALHILGQRTWGEVRGAVVETTAGRFEGGEHAAPSIMFHLGTPARVRALHVSDRGARWHMRGDYEVVPAASRGCWEDFDPTLTMSLWLPSSLLASVARDVRSALRDGQLDAVDGQTDRRLFQIALCIEAEIEAGDAADPLYAESAVVALVGRLLLLHGRARPTKAERQLSKRQTKITLEYIESNLDRSVALAEMSSLVGLSPSHFRTLFRQTTGTSLHQFVMARRVERAVELLRSGRANITEAALDSGFCHPSHMARCMRRITGLLPSDLVQDRLR